MAGQTTGYTYSSRGELTKVDLPDGTVVAYVHDPLGRRIAKKVGGTVTEKYLWQGHTRLLAVYDGSGSLKQRFEYADARLPVAMTQGSTRYFLIYDQVGSLRAVTDASGGIVKTVDYDSFGNVIADSAPTFAVPFGFAGGLFDPNTGLTRFGYRDYDADVGRWTAKDPILFEGGDTDLYGYVVGNPVNGVDPEGKFAAAAFEAGALAGGSIAGPPGAVIGAVVGSVGAYIAGQWAYNHWIYNSSSNPFKGEPGSESTIHTPNGQPKQTRRYGQDGYPESDTDYDHDHGQGQPHIHDWGRPSDGSPPTHKDRGKGRSPKQSDPCNP